MAYAAVISLKNTIERLQKSSHVVLVHHSPETIQSAYEDVQSLQETLKRLNKSGMSSSSWKRVNTLDEQIREAVFEFEDLLESHVSNQFLSQYKEGLYSRRRQFRIDLKDLKPDIHSFRETLKKMAEKHKEALRNPLLEEEDDDEAVLTRIDFGRNKSKMVGLSDQYKELKHKLVFDSPTPFEVVTLTGMAGIGKTTLAKEIFEDPLVVSHFDFRAWVAVGKKSQLQEKPGDFMQAQVFTSRGKMLVEGDEEIAAYLKETFQYKRHFIVLDDVWDRQVFNYLKSSFQACRNGSWVLLTTRLQHVAPFHFGAILKMRLLDKEESWDLLREKVFARERSPSQLEVPGKKIAENCEGLPLTIVTVANLLSGDKTLEHWSKVAEQKNHQLFMDAYDKILKVLYPSYEHLTQDLKMCFLYMGVFPPNYEISKSKLIKMWTVEGFLEPNRWQTFEEYIEKCLKELVSHNVVMPHQRSSFTEIILMSIGIKTCALHSSMWHLCNREARNNKFFHVINNYANGLSDGIKSQRRLCIHNNILFGIKEVYNSIEDGCASTARSLLCFGAYHQYSVPICFSLGLLKVLDALTIRFYRFPMEVLKLVQLRYLALKCNGKLPTSISKLWKLQFLIVHRHLSIESYGDLSYLPMEIWTMKELKHLEIMGSGLPNPHTYGAFLQNLLTLLDVSARSCNSSVFNRIPNLKKLGIRIELAPDSIEPLTCFDHISYLNKLRILKCVVVNPQHKSKVATPLAPLSMFPWGLKKLSLSGMGYPWEEMSKIASLRYLKVLKLRNYAFRGPKWELAEDEFKSLEFLLIEDTDLVQWKVGHGSFPWLSSLSIKCCFKLKELHWEFGQDFKKIELVDCNPLVVTHVKQIKGDRHAPAVHVYSSWEVGKLKI